MRIRHTHTRTDTAHTPLSRHTHTHTLTQRERDTVPVFELTRYIYYRSMIIHHPSTRTRHSLSHRTQTQHHTHTRSQNRKMTNDKNPYLVYLGQSRTRVLLLLSHTRHTDWPQRAPQPRRATRAAAISILRPHTTSDYYRPHCSTPDRRGATRAQARSISNASWGTCTATSCAAGPRAARRT